MTRRVVGAVLASIVLAMVTVPLVAHRADAQSARPLLTLVHQTPFVGPTGTFTAQFTTTDLPPDTRLVVTVYQAVSARSRLEAAMSGQQLGSVITSTPSTPIASTGPTVVTLPVTAVWPAPANGAVLSNPGVYPLTIDAVRPDGSRLDRFVTQVIRLPAADAATTPLAVGTIVTIDATPTVDRDGNLVLSADESGRAAERMAILDEATTPSLSLAATPFVVDALREEGVSFAAVTARRQTIATPWVPIDSATLLASRQESLVVDEFAIGTTALTSVFGAAPDQRVAVIDGTTSPRALDLAGARGTNAVILDAAQIRDALGTDEGAVLTQRFSVVSENGSRFSAMASDDRIAATFAFGRDPVLAANQALALLAMLHFDQPGAGRGVAVEIPAPTAPAALREFLTGLAARTGTSSGSTGAAIVEPVTLDGLLAATSAATDRSGTVVRPWTSTDPADPAPWITALDQARWDLRGLRSMLPDGESEVAPVERRILGAADRWLDDGDHLAAVVGAERAIRAVAGGITLPSTQRFTLTSSSGDVPLTIENALTTAAHVRITLRSPKLDFPDSPVIDLVLAPGSNRTTVPVRTRASGAFPMEVTIASVDGVLPVTSSRVDVRSTAISGWGLVLSIGAGLFLAVWWLRHFRHTRRARSLIPVDDAEA